MAVGCPSTDRNGMPTVCAEVRVIADLNVESCGTGPAVGRIYAVNTVGAIVGALLAGFVLVPRLGTRPTLLGVCVVAATLGCAFAFWGKRPRWLPAAGVAALALVALGVYGCPAWNFLELHTGVFEPGRIEGTVTDTLTLPGEKVLFQREGPTASVLVAKRPSGHRNLVINARVNASDTPTDMATQVLLAELPLLLAPRGDDVFVIGWGSGVSAGSALLWPATRVTAVEIEPAVVQGSKFFRRVNHDPLHNPRLRLYEDDARHILLADEATYDVIMSEPAHPWVAGVANLFTQDFYRIATRRLRPDGLFAQWVQVYQISPESFRAIIAAFQSVLPEAMVFRPPNGTDVILLGSRLPLRIDLEDLGRRWQPAPVREDLARIGLERPEDLLASFYLGPAAVRALAAGARINTDNNMYVELRGPREMIGAPTGASAILGALARDATPVETVLVAPGALLDRPDRLEAFVASLAARERPTTLYAERLRAFSH